jgi:hypothetical protein
MRREWSGWIKTRQWSEFEKLAKVEPSQALVDTIAELALGFPDKPDRRALKKVLFLLSQAGYEPRELDEPFGDQARLVEPLTAAFMVSPDGSGDTVFTLGREERGRVAWLIAHLTYREGITRAIEDTTPLDEAQTRLVRLRNMAPTSSISAEVPVKFAFSRLAQAVSITKSLPPVMAYWRALLPKEYPESHPADALPRLPVVNEDLVKLAGGLKSIVLWRLELGLLAPALEDFIKNHAESGTSENFQDLNWWHTVLAQDRVQLFTDDVVADHRLRLLDLAYIMHLRGDADGGAVLALADDLRTNGADSAYAQSITSKTFLLLLETLRRQSATERSEGTRGERP